MGRPAKDGKFVNFLMDSALVKKIDQVAAITGKTKTTVMETALRQYIEPFCQTDGTIHAVEGIYVKTKKSCKVLDAFALTAESDIYYKIFVDGTILTVPARDVVVD